jgi:hypothetical protein
LHSLPSSPNVFSVFLFTAHPFFLFFFLSIIISLFRHLFSSSFLPAILLLFLSFSS